MNVNYILDMIFIKADSKKEIKTMDSCLRVMMIIFTKLDCKKSEDFLSAFFW